MPSLGRTAVALWPAMASLILCAGLAAAPGGRLMQASSTSEGLLDAGRYAEAEAEAARALDRASPADADAATGLLIDALLRNGRGAEARTLELAERLVRTDRLPGTARGHLATSLRRLGD